MAIDAKSKKDPEFLWKSDWSFSSYVGSQQNIFDFPSKLIFCLFDIQDHFQGVGRTRAFSFDSRNSTSLIFQFRQCTECGDSSRNATNRPWIRIYEGKKASFVRYWQKIAADDFWLKK